MLKNIIVYLTVLISALVFNIFYYAWFSWFLFLAVLLVPFLSLTVSLPFMIISVLNGFTASCQNHVYKGESIRIAIEGKNRKNIITPFLKIKFKAKNNFSKQTRKINFKYGGMINKAVVISDSKSSQNCGDIKIQAR
jgi:hypothetical protein